MVHLRFSDIVVLCKAGIAVDGSCN